MSNIFSTKMDYSSRDIFENKVVVKFRNKVPKIAFGKTELTNATHGPYILLTTIFQE